MLPMAPYATGTAAAMMQARSLRAVVEFDFNPMRMLRRFFFIQINGVVGRLRRRRTVVSNDHKGDQAACDQASRREPR